jgi:hypothetical protein
LLTLNDEQFIEAARHLAQQTLLETGRDRYEDCLQAIAIRLLARPWSQEEMVVVRRSLDDLLAYYRNHRDDADRLLSVGQSKPDPSITPEQLAAWTMLTNELMNLDEVLNK